MVLQRRRPFASTIGLDIRHHPIEGLHEVVLRRREEVRIHLRDLGGLVSHAISDGRWRIAAVDEGADVGVADVVDADALHPREPAPPLHLMGQCVLRDGEEPVIWSDFGVCRQVITQLLAKEARHDDVSLRGACLGRADNVLALDAGVGTANPDDVEPEVDVLGSEGEELALAAARKIEREKRQIEQRLVLDGLGEALELVGGPIEHLLLGTLGANLSCGKHGVLGQAIETHRVVEDGRELVAYRVEVALGKALFQKPVLPAHDVRGLYIAKALFAEEREDVFVDDGVLGQLGPDAQTGIDVAGVHRHDKRFDGDLDALVAGSEKIALPGDSVLLGRKTTLRLLVTLAHGIAVPSLDGPGSALFVSANRHGSSPLSA